MSRPVGPCRLRQMVSDSWCGRGSVEFNLARDQAREQEVARSAEVLDLAAEAENFQEHRLNKPMIMSKQVARWADNFHRFELTLVDVAHRRAEILQSLFCSLEAKKQELPDGRVRQHHGVDLLIRLAVHGRDGDNSNRADATDAD